jgi:hypothetical protein
VHQLRPGDPYELSRGHAIRVPPVSVERTRWRGRVVGIISADPMVRAAGLDPGFKLDDGTLRAPDVAVLPDEVPPGWLEGVPTLAIEYAGVGQDEAMLQAKIDELVAAGTRYLWVVRLVGPRRVEVYEGGQRRVALEDDVLAAPGVLQNEIPVRAMFDADAACELQLTNLLQRSGYRSVEHVRQEARDAGRHEGLEAGRDEARDALARLLLQTLRDRGFEPDAAAISAITAADVTTLGSWLARSGTVTGLRELL